MTAPDRPRYRPGRGLAERVSASTARTDALRLRAGSLAAQVTRATQPIEAPRPEPARLLAVQQVAAAFYRGQLDQPGGAGPARWLAEQGVPVDGRWTVGYAPDRPAGLVNELRRRGFTDVEILASGLAATGRGGQLVDRFRDRVMVGIRDHRDPAAPLVGFVGYAAPGAGPDVPPVLQGPATAIYRPPLVDLESASDAV